ncbi:MAG: replicative DNA helicase [Mycobacteriales bacterium]
MAITDPASAVPPPSPEFERQPPQDIAAEQCVLGSMMLSKDAIADVVEHLKSVDFYRPAHQVVYDTVLNLYGRGEPADMVTVVAELTKSGQIARVGGAPYIHTLINTVPTAANAGYYARIVSERAILRRLVEAGTKVAQIGWGAASGSGLEVDEAVDRAQQAVYEVTEHRAGEDYVILQELLTGTLDEIESISNRSGAMGGIPTGFTDLDAYTNGLHAGQLIVVAARPGVGKALALDTPLPTPDGWTTMAEVRVGDRLLSATGTATTVVAATGVLDGRPCYEIEFSDGTKIVADAAHQWPVGADRAATVRTTEELAAAVASGEKPLVPPIEPLIPAGYPRAAEPQRRKLLAGTGSVVTIETDDGAFRDEDHRLEHRLRRQGRYARHVLAVRPVPSVPVRCVEVDDPDHLYLAGRGMIPTHNSTLGLDFARSCSIKHHMTSVVFSLEMSKSEITMRLLSAEARVALHAMRSGTLTDDDWARLARRMGEIADAPLYIDDSPNMTLMEIRAKARRLKQRHDLRFIVVDYLQLMTPPKRLDSRQQEVSELSRGLKLLAKELEVPVVMISQLNRGPEQRTDKRPQLSDLRESGCMTRDTTLLRADTGAPVTFGDLLDNGHDGVLVWSLDENRGVVAAPVTNVFASGIKETYRLRLASGREVSASGNHPFLTPDGWTALDDLRPGDRIAIPGRIPEPVGAGPGWTESRLGLLAHLLGDGCVVESAAAEFGIGGPRGHEKRLPEVLYSASNAELAVFLRHLWATGGSVTEPSGAAGGVSEAHYSSSSRALIDGVASLLARFGIIGRIRAVRAGHRRQHYHLTVSDGPGLRAFRRVIEGGAVDPPPATDDVRWDEVVAIEPLGPRPVYDATVKGTHSFIADGIVAHNSIEQDADAVLMVYREDVFEKESPRAGEADLILAKHRNGPTGTITVAFQGHYSRFVDMAQ